jgi:hypothetical protein
MPVQIALDDDTGTEGEVKLTITITKRAKCNDNEEQAKQVYQHVSNDKTKKARQLEDDDSDKDEDEDEEEKEQSSDDGNGLMPFTNNTTFRSQKEFYKYIYYLFDGFDKVAIILPYRGGNADTFANYLKTVSYQIWTYLKEQRKSIITPTVKPNCVMKTPTSMKFEASCRWSEIQPGGLEVVKSMNVFLDSHKEQLTDTSADIWLVYLNAEDVPYRFTTSDARGSATYYDFSEFIWEEKIMTTAEYYEW